MSESEEVGRKFYDTSPVIVRYVSESASNLSKLYIESSSVKIMKKAGKLESRTEKVIELTNNAIKFVKEFDDPSKTVISLAFVANAFVIGRARMNLNEEIKFLMQKYKRMQIYSQIAQRYLSMVTSSKNVDEATIKNLIRSLNTLVDNIRWYLRGMTSLYYKSTAVLVKVGVLGRYSESDNWVSIDEEIESKIKNKKKAKIKGNLKEEIAIDPTILDANSRFDIDESEDENMDDDNSDNKDSDNDNI